MSFHSTLPQVKRQLVQNILEKDSGASSPEMLQSLGSSVSVLPLSILSRFTPKDLNNTLSSFRQAKWSLAQAKTLAQKLLENATV